MGSDALESRQALQAILNTSQEVADVRKSLISASPLLERVTSLYWRKAEDAVQEFDTIPLERTSSIFSVRFWTPKIFHK